MMRFHLVHQENMLQCIKNSKIQTRPNASPGLWSMFLLPLALIISTASQPIISTASYKLSSIFSVGIILSNCIFILQSVKKKKLDFFNSWILLSSCLVALLFRVCLHRGIYFSLWSAIFSTVINQQILSLVLKKMTLCFTLGEAAIFAQSYTLLLYYTLLNIAENFVKPATNVMQICTLIIQVGLFGLSAIALLVYQFKIKTPLKFYIVSLLVIVFVIVVPLQILLEKNPFVFVIHLLYQDLQTNKVIIYWTISSVVAVAFVNKKVNEAKKASTSLRKAFHVLTIAVFVPGLLYNCSFLYLATGVILGIFVFLEMLLVLDIPPLANSLQNGLVVFGDEKDAGIIALTPLYLLAGCSLPLWIHPAPCDVTNSTTFTLLPLLSGLLTIGVGDTSASIIGSTLGKLHWNGSKKTVEGTVACIVSQLLFIYLFVYLDFVKVFSASGVVQIVVAVVIPSLIEAKTDQVDNLVLPFVMYIMLVCM